jgi:hypothetical protein
VDLREVQTVTEGAKGPIKLSVLVIRDPTAERTPGEPVLQVRSIHPGR